MGGRAFDVTVIGGGIAGMATAWALVRRGAGRVLLVEQEALLAQHASGRNAAIYRQLEHSFAASVLALTSGRLFSVLNGDGEGLIRRTGAIYLGKRDDIVTLLRIAKELGVAASQVDPTMLDGEDVPRLSAVLVPGDGVIDVHGVVAALAQALRAAGTVRTGARALRILVEDRVVNGVELDSGERIECAEVIVAAGAWCAELAERSGLSMPLVPRRRHLALLESTTARQAAPVIWRIDGDEVYFRPESGGMLASPCDESDWPACVPPADSEALVKLGEKLARIAPGLAGAGVRRTWACLRTFAPDRAFVVGRDAAVRGLAFVGGLGGRGMSVGLGAGDLCAALMLGQPVPVDERVVQAVDPGRLR